jgi:hypothetical protein
MFGDWRKTAPLAAAEDMLPLADACGFTGGSIKQGF